MAGPSTTPAPASALPPVASETRFVNGMRLSARQWLAVAALVTIALFGVPPLWKKVERFETGVDYRIPYALSSDYWLYERRLQRVNASHIAILGDSVVWGEYVLPEGTLSHFLNEESEQPERFLNAGVNGLFPLAFEGLIQDYGESLSRRKVILHCNVLWMSSPKADLRTRKEERFNHADLVPQFSPRIPCYKADLNKRLAIVVERHCPFLQWVNHLRVAYFEQKNVLEWTLEEDSSTPLSYPNAFKNPLGQITMMVPSEPADDPDRGPSASRHTPWSTTGQGSMRFEWVELEESLQWAAFRRLLKLLQSRGNDVLVLVGPFNEHVMAEMNRPTFRRLRDGIADWLAKNQVQFVVPATLPSGLYADASHPLTEGYQVLANRLHNDPVFRKWMESGPVAPTASNSSAQPNGP